MTPQELKEHLELVKEMQKASLELKQGMLETKTESGSRIANILEMHVEDYQREIDWIASEQGSGE